MKKFVANSNYNIVIFAKDLRTAKKIYSRMIIDSLFNEKETITITNLKEVEQ